MNAGSRPTRSARAILSRELIVETAVELVAQADDVSIRDLAAQLEVSPMALYRHVDSKEDLLDDVVDRLLTDYWRPEVDPQDWRAWMVDAADRLRSFLVKRPAAIQVYLRRPVRSPVAMERMRKCLDVLRDGIGDDGRAHSAFAAVHSYTLGFAALESAREANPVADDAVADAVLHELVSYASPAQFHAGVRYLLDGVAPQELTAGRTGASLNID